MGKCRKPTPRRCLAIWVQVPCGPVGALPSWSPLSGAHRRSARQAGRLGDRRHFGSVLAAAVPDPLPGRTLPGGRYQILPIAWDGLPQTESGQRWFHLYRKRRVGHRDPLLWTGRYQNGALQCAECQSTQLRKGYGAAPQTQQTTFTEIDVACESCHGPASVHVDGARSARLPDAVSDGQASPAVRTSVKSENPAPRSRAVTTWQCSRPRTSRQTVGNGTRSMAGLRFCRAGCTGAASLAWIATNRVRRNFVRTALHHARSATPRPSSIPPRAIAADGKGATCDACRRPTQIYVVMPVHQDHSLRIPAPNLSIARPIRPSRQSSGRLL